MLKVVLMGVAAIFLSMLAGNIRREYGIAIALCAAAALSAYGLSRISLIMEQIQAFENAIGLEHEYMAILFKMVGIAYLTQLAVSLCGDAGQGAIASQIGFAGKVSMLIVSLPVISSLVKTIGELLS